MGRLRCGSCFAALVVAGGSLLHAQGLTGTFFVNVKDAKGKPLSGVRVEIKSDRLMIPRVGFTDDNGMFRAPLLSPGSYYATVSKEGFAASGIHAQVPLGASVTGDAVLNAMAIPEAVVSTVAVSGKLDKTEVAVSDNYRAGDIEKLPVKNDLDAIVGLAPFVNKNLAGKTLMSGAASYENKYLLNGTDINDPYFGSYNELFIEDALEETQVLGNCISAEHGRFMGGVVNAVTKRGGNEFSGSFRGVMTNNHWNALKPGQRRSDFPNYLNQVYSATLGGPIRKDKLWFFFAGRSNKTNLSSALPFTGLSYCTPTDQKRWELNLTYQPHTDHRLGFSYLGFLEKANNTFSLFSDGVTPDTLRNRRYPNSLKSLTYDWIITPSLNLSLLATEKKQRLEFSPIKPGLAFYDSPVLTPGDRLYNNTYFGFTPEDRDNRNFKAVFTQFFEAAGSHELKAGYEYFEEINAGKNEQTPTGYIIRASGVEPAENWRDIRFVFNDKSTLIDARTTPGGTFHSRYHSLFINDNWAWDNCLNFSLGLRYDLWHGDKKAGYKGPGIMSLMPRLGVNYDPWGDGAWQYSLTYAQYASKINSSISQAGTYVGNWGESVYPSLLQSTATSLPGPNQPGFRRGDYGLTPISIKDPAHTVIIDRNLRAPVTHEWTLQLKHRVGQAGVFTLMGVRRDYRDLFEDFIGHDGFYQPDPNGPKFSITRWGNAGPLAERNYTALMAAYEDSADLWKGKLAYSGHLTLSRLYGNYDSDEANNPGGGSPLGNYPLAFKDSAPLGRLESDEPLRIKLLGTWTRPVTRTGNLTLSLKADYASGKPYSHKQERLYNGPTLGYVDVQGKTYVRYYGPRGLHRFPSWYTSDLAVGWEDKTRFRSLSYFGKLVVYNWLNHIQAVSFDVSGVGDSEVFVPSPTYGRPTTQRDYIGNRSIELQAGVRF